MSLVGSCVCTMISPRMPWARATPPISRSSRSDTRLFEDLDERPLARTRRDLLHDRAQRAGGLAAATDDLTEIALGDLELEHVGGALFDELDANFIGLVDEVHRHEADQLGQIGF